MIAMCSDPELWPGVVAQKQFQILCKEETSSCAKERGGLCWRDQKAKSQRCFLRFAGERQLDKKSLWVSPGSEGRSTECFDFDRDSKIRHPQSPPVCSGVVCGFRHFPSQRWKWEERARAWTDLDCGFWSCCWSVLAHTSECWIGVRSLAANVCKKPPHVDSYLNIGTRQSSGHQSNGQLATYNTRSAVGSAKLSFSAISWEPLVAAGRSNRPMRNATAYGVVVKVFASSQQTSCMRRPGPSADMR